MIGSGPHQQKPMGSQQQDNFLNLECERDREGSMHIMHTSRSHSRVGGHISQEQQNRAMQLEIDNLKKELRHAQRKRAFSRYDISFNDEEDTSYKRRTRTPPSESSSYDEEHHHTHKYKSPPRRGLENDTMNKALN